MHNVLFDSKALNGDAQYCVQIMSYLVGSDYASFSTAAARIWGRDGDRSRLRQSGGIYGSLRALFSLCPEDVKRTGNH
jgi:hypothetical protein